MREKLIEQVDHLSIEETKTVFENVKKLLISNVKKVKEFNFNAIPDTTEPVVFTKEEYQNYLLTKYVLQILKNLKKEYNFIMKEWLKNILKDLLKQNKGGASNGI